MNKPLDRSELTAMIRDGLPYSKAGTVRHADSVLKLPAKRYYDPEIFEEEKAKIFRRVPLLLAVTAEMRNPGDFKTLEAAGVPVLLTRGQDGVVRGFVNSCSHRGTAVAAEPCGNARRFVCPYHGWTFTQKGELMGVASAQDFGDIDKASYGLVPLPVTEREGLIWGIVDSNSTLSFDAFLAGYDKVLAHFGFADWHFF
jgi:phenylpropionate dioxygenase-like ring-hydroxylating dioxygenase large terminal subunit